MKSKFSDQVAEEAKEQKTRGNKYGHLNLPKNVNVFKEAADTRVMLDFLPYRVTDPKHPDRKDESERAVPNALWYKRPYRLHRSIGASNESLVCPGSVGKKCPICEYRKKLVAKNADKEDIKALNSSLRNLYIVVPIGHKDYEEKPYVWDVSQFLFQDILRDEIEDDPEARSSFADLEEGLTLKIRFSEETTGKTKFAKTNRIDFVERSNTYSSKILNKVPNLDEMLIILSYDEINNKFMEEEEEEVKSSKKKHTEEEDEEKVSKKIPWEDEEDEEEEVTKPKRRISKDEDDEDEEEEQPRKKSKKPVKDEDDEEDEKPSSHKSKKDNEDEEDEEEEQPRKKSKKPVKDDEDEDEEDEEEEQPRKKSKKPVKDDEDEDEEDEENEKPKKKITNKCPHGYTFGKDCEKNDECDECAVWEACYETKEKIKKG